MLGCNFDWKASTMREKATVNGQLIKAKGRRWRKEREIKKGGKERGKKSRACGNEMARPRRARSSSG